MIRDRRASSSIWPVVSVEWMMEKEVEALLKERLSTRGFTFTNIQSSVKPNDVLQAAIVYRWKYVTILEVAMTSS
ncbi:MULTISPECIES: hypothetical protein [Bacteroides]|nr:MULTISPECIES: hypothetical protein [Bacteroides]MCM1627891.1 hypothetical protein [Bacteroides uniformis]MCM1630602.1 hypothetical protein [Bacteroides uniformis]MCM1665437.1 hypothetical protein [Bacteroides uniformis]MCM1701398.1 hypothetical protein [Bacteroides uniformis]MCM1727799.1 hypothetical protein [Bacteroides uniformis]